MTLRRLGVPAGIGVLLPLALFASPLSAQQCPAMGHGELPLKYAGPGTTAAITPCDLMTRLYIFADDSMAGRRTATADNARAVAYVEREVRRLGLKPAGDGASYLQALPVVTRGLDTTSTLTVDGKVLKAGTDFLVSSSMLHPAEFTGGQLVYGGALLDTTVTIPDSVTNGRLVVFRPIVDPANSGAIQRTPRGEAWVRWYNTVRRVTLTAAEQLPAANLRAALNPTQLLFLVEQGGTVTFTFTPHAVDVLLGTPLSTATPGTVGKPFRADLRFHDAPRPANNLIALLPGSDPKLRAEYVVLGAHTDHVGTTRPVDHDSLRIFNMVTRPEGVYSRKQTTEDEEYERIALLTDSIRKVRPGRPDSIYNGADMGGSGAVSLLEIAEAMARGSARPKRSILFVWHIGSETAAASGASWFTAHPTVPLASMVAELNLDAVGRGEATDETGITGDETPTHGNPNYVEVIGSRRLSSELGRVIEEANTAARTGLALDYAADADGHPDRLYCRNDQWQYARRGIPTAFFTTGNNADTREPTDEPQYIQYRHMAWVDQLVLAATVKLANLDHRVVIDHPKPDPAAPCQQ